MKQSNLQQNQCQAPPNRIDQNGAYTLDSIIKTIQQIVQTMPRIEKLNKITPNRFYTVEGVVKYKNQSEGFTTLIIQAQNTQKRVKIPWSEISLEVGQNYRFNNCFYNSLDWLNVRKPQQFISPINMSQQTITPFLKPLASLKQALSQFEQMYFNISLFIYEVPPTQIMVKGDKQIIYQVLKGHQQGCLVDVTVWNFNIDMNKLLNQQVIFQGVRIKKLTEDKFILVTSVYTNMTVDQNPQILSSNIPIFQNCQNLSEIYSKRRVQQLSDMHIPNTKKFSIVKAKVKSILTADYVGCSKCKRKIDKHCAFCNIEIQLNYTYGKVLLEEDGSTVEVIVFDQKIRQLFKFAKENCSIQAKIKTFQRVQDGETLISHILTKIDSIFF